MRVVPSLYRRVNNLTRMIETKEGTWKTAPNVELRHNNTTLLNNTTGASLNIFQSTQGAGDPMQAGVMNRIGDQISVKGVKIVSFFENALQRAKVHYRLMLLKGPRGAPFNRADIFKNDSDNKMIDCLNTEKYTIIAQKRFNIETSNTAPATVGGTGVPNTGTAAGIGTRVVNMWIPGRRFGKGGTVKYENATSTDVKFYDYRIVIVAYDWFGTPQDTNTVGQLNELYTKIYFKDA